MRAVPTSSKASLHHIGFVVSSISEVGADFAFSLGAEWNGEVIHDALQQARVTFMYCEPDAPAIELVEPDTEHSPLIRFRSKGGGLHHICYEVDFLDQRLDYCRSAGALVVKQPLPAVAFGGRRIAWVYTKEKLLVEYLER
jgi:methylmalonyl-CoA/ethylmalonyl-CoA epimerase